MNHQRNYCRRGHDLTAPGSTEPDGSCVNCLARDEHMRKAGMVGKQAAKKAKAKRPVPNSMESILDEQWRVNRILEIGRALERNPMPWERESLESEFRRLRDMEVQA